MLANPKPLKVKTLARGSNLIRKAKRPDQTKARKMNWQIIKSNIKEAREQLEKLERAISSDDPPDEVELQLMLEHAYHHLNFAWNIRDASTEQYASMTDEDFNRWGKFPTDIEVCQLTNDKK